EAEAGDDLVVAPVARARREVLAVEVEHRHAAPAQVAPRIVVRERRQFQLAAVSLELLTPDLPELAMRDVADPAPEPPDARCAGSAAGGAKGERAARRGRGGVVVRRDRDVVAGVFEAQAERDERLDVAARAHRDENDVHRLTMITRLRRI